MSGWEQEKGTLVREINCMVFHSRRKSNILPRDVAFVNTHTERDVKKFAKEMLGVNIKVKEAIMIGSTDTIVRLASWKEKQEIMKTKRNCARSTFI